MIEERRKYIRLDTAIEFTYKIKDAQQKEIRAATRNISPGGVRAMLQKQIKTGDWLELNIDIPTLKKPLFAIGKVIWTADEKAGKIEAGIKFEEIDTEIKNKFLEYICELMYSQLEKLKV